LLIVVWGALAVGLPQNPANELAPIQTQVALPQTRATEDALEPKDRLALQRDLIEYEADSRVRTWTLLAQVIGALILGFGGYFAWRNLHVAQEGQITNRFSQAINQLGAEKDGKPNLEVRLGGIYALERIARDSPRDHWTIMEILTAYVRENVPGVEPQPSPSDPHDPYGDAGTLYEAAGAPPDVITPPAPPPALRTDVQAILTVLRRRERSVDRAEPAGLDLRVTNLRGANLEGAQLQRANLEHVDLEQANLKNAKLQGATLRGAHLEHANLEGANLKEAKIEDADLQWAILKGAHLERADLFRARLKGAWLDSADLEGAVLYVSRLEWARLQGADLRGADLETAALEWAILEGAHLEHANLERTHLEHANLRTAHLDGASLLGAHLDGANLWGAHLDGASLWGAQLRGAQLGGSTFITQEQVYSARDHGEGAFLPDDWPADWRNNFGKSAEQPDVIPPAP
jgi:uncharacterized protein YjbI with pentapeptide repeats